METVTRTIDTQALAKERERLTGGRIKLWYQARSGAYKVGQLEGRISELKKNENARVANMFAMGVPAAGLGIDAFVAYASQGEFRIPEALVAGFLGFAAFAQYYAGPYRRSHLDNELNGAKILADKTEQPIVNLIIDYTRLRDGKN